MKPNHANQGDAAASVHPDMDALVLDLVDHLDAMIAYWDRDQVCIFANQAYRQWFGKGRSAVIGSTLHDLLGPVLYDKNLPFIRAAYAGEKQVFERDIPTPDGKVRPSLATYIPRIVDGVVQGIYAHVADVTLLKRLEGELKAAKERAEHLATHDFLTGLPNRVLMLEQLERAIEEAQQNDAGMGVLTLDVDNFKRINDTYGHHAGDEFLIAIADCLKRSLREGDAVVRIAGDEFLLIAARIDSALQAEALVGRIFRELRHSVRLGDADVAPTLSVGIALYPQHGSTAEALLVSSDRALYAAKALGRNRCALAEPLDA